MSVNLIERGRAGKAGGQAKEKTQLWACPDGSVKVGWAGMRRRSGKCHGTPGCLARGAFLVEGE